MAAYHLTADELLLIYLTFLARDEEGHSEYFTQWFNNGGQERLKDLFNSLKEKGVIIKNYNPSSYIPNEIEFNKHFLHTWLKNGGEMGRELFTEYPPFLNIQGKYVPLRDISKRFTSLDEFFFYYGVQIGNNPAKHRKIMDILKWSKENNLLNFGILNFVISHQWEALEELKNNPEMIPFATNICIDE